MRVELRGMEFRYGPRMPVIRGISFTLDKPEFVCIMGPNGVGKSTMIHCINKILRPTGGTVLVNDVDVARTKLRDLASRLGYVPASSGDSYPLTVVDTIMVGLQNDFKYGTSKEDLQKVYDVLRLMKIEHLAMRNFNELSAGQHQKVVLARGLVRSPEVVLLDEPTSNLDIKHQLEVTKVLSRLPKERGMLVIMISHDINITAKYADRIIMLHDGEIFAIGTPKEVLTRENIRAVYGVDADIMEVNGRPHVILNDSVEDGIAADLNGRRRGRDSRMGVLPGPACSSPSASDTTWLSPTCTDRRGARVLTPADAPPLADDPEGPLVSFLRGLPVRVIESAVIRTLVAI